MDTSVFIAQLLGTVYLLVGTGMFLSKSHYDKLLKNFQESAALIYLGGILAFVVGFLIIKYHWVWTSDWRSLITLIACFAILKGVLLLLIPNIFLNLFKVSYLSFARWTALALGLLFCYFGYYSH